MILYQNFDLLLRKVISILYRILIIAFSISILIRNNNYFAWYIYLGSTIAYILTFAFLFNKDKFLSVLRLIADFVFVLLILYNKDINNFHTMTLIFLPLINSVNHSSNVRPKLSPFILYLLTFLLIFVLRDFKFVLGDLVALIAIWIVNIFLSMRHFLVKMFGGVDEIIDKFYQEKIKIDKIYTLLRSIKSKINNNNKVTFLVHKPEDIAIFYLKNNKLALISASNFVYKCEYNDSTNFLTESNENNFVRNFNISFDSKSVEPNIAYKITHSENTYLYIVTIKDQLTNGLKDKISNKIFYPIFYKISKLLEIEKEISKEKKEYLKKIKKKMIFVDSTIKAIHFLNNRLTPISNYFDLVKKIEAIEDSEIRNQLQIIINQERKAATSNIDFIIERMKRTLEKSNNPYIISSNENIGIQKLYSIIRRSWQESNLESENLTLACQEDFMKRVTNLNVESFEFLLDELISNILKHSESYKAIEIGQEDDLLIIRLINDIKDYNKVIEDLRIIIGYFNTEEINEILKKTSYGLAYIKDTLKQLNLVHNMLITEDKKIVILLKIKTQIYNENIII